MQYAIATSACRRGCSEVQVSCSNHAVSAIIAGTANHENAFSLVDWVETVERLRDGETRKFHQSEGYH